MKIENILGIWKEMDGGTILEMVPIYNYQVCDRN